MSVRRRSRVAYEVCDADATDEWEVERPGLAKEEQPWSADASAFEAKPASTFGLSRAPKRPSIRLFVLAALGLVLAGLLLVAVVALTRGSAQPSSRSRRRAAVASAASVFAPAKARRATPPKRHRNGSRRAHAMGRRSTSIEKASDPALAPARRKPTRRLAAASADEGVPSGHRAIQAQAAWPAWGIASQTQSDACLCASAVDEFGFER